MGVKGLWRLLLPIGRRISLETLQGQILAIDASIWLTQFLKALRDPQTGKSQPAAHLIGFIRRLCRLYFHGIRPVLVFDGATPEIKQREILNRRKRREQFATAASDAGVQRLARRLLAQNLRKIKQSSSSSSLDGKRSKTQPSGENRAGLAPGFHPGSQSSWTRTVQSAAAAKDPLQQQQQENNGSNNDRKDPPKISAQDEAAILASIRQDLEDAEKEGEEIVLSNDNDWDNVIVIDDNEAKEEEEDATTNRQDKDQDVEYEDFGLRQAKIEFKKQIDMDYIASLPSNKRKDAIEQAKRQQRLQSRREFMPAAGNMDQFSSVQIQNFLKSSRLNLDIQKMAKEEVKRSNQHGGGDLMAADRTTRISLIRENENQANDQSDDEGPIEDDPLFRRRLAKRQRLIFRKDSLSEEDEEIDWQEGRKNESVPAAAIKTGRRALMDDDSSDEEMPSTSQNGSIAQRNESVDTEKHPPKPADSSGLPNDFEGGGFLPNDFEGGGGFLPASISPAHTNPRLEIVDVAMKSERKSNNLEMIHLEDDDSSQSGSSNGGGGFLTERDQSVSIKKVVIELKDDNSCPGGGVLTTNDTVKEQGGPEITKVKDSYRGGSATRPDTSMDAAIAQEMADAMLAKALQQEGGTNTPSTTVRVGQAQLFQIASDDSSSEGIEWEDGDKGQEQTADTSHGKSIDLTLKQQDTDRENKNDGDDDVAWVEGDEAKQIEGKPMDNQDDDEFDDIQWIDGENVETTPTRATEKVETEKEKEDKAEKPQGGKEDACYSGESEIQMGEMAPQKRDCRKKHAARGERPLAANGGQTNPADIFPISGSQSEDYTRNTEWGVEDASDWGTLDDVTSPSRPTGQHSDDRNQTSAAFARAEETAANLAGWAGRAVRRAMRESGIVEENGGTPNTKDNDAYEDQHFVVVPKTNQPHNHRTTRTSTGNINNPMHGSPAKPTARTTSSLQNRLPQLTENEARRAATTAMLQEYEAQWAKERNQRERDVDTVTDEMKEEAMLLLRLFGVPYVESPAEAEAQCAALEQLGLVDGIVTEDSDVFVFGGKKVYKNIFDERLYAEAYMADDAEREMSIGRNAMVALAMLLGSDYTEGVKGVGIVNAMEVLKAFDVAEDLREGLKSFRVWLDGFDPSDVLKLSEGEEVTTRKSFHAKHKSARSRWVAPEHFPADNIINAYVNPVVDKSPDKFSWGVPDVEGLVAFCSRHIGWAEGETRKLLEPVVERLQSGSRYRQTRLDSFMRYDDGIKFADVKSKRLREVLGLTEDSKPAAKKTKSKI